MPPKGKRGKGQKLSLAEFVGPQDDATNDWAEDVWSPEDGAGGGQGGGQGADGKPGLFGHGVNRHLGDFRSEERAQLTTVVPDDMEPPYTAHVGNLTHGITEEELREGFAPNEIINIRINRTKATYAFVEFDSREALQAAILLTNKYVKGRPLKVDVATKQQQERMMAGDRPMGGGGGFAELSRDAIGAAQQPAWEGAGFRDGPMRREPVGELSRDVFGAQQAPSAPGGGRDTMMGGGGGGPIEFDRNAMGQAKQPEFRGFGGGGERRERRGGGGGDSGKASPVARDAPAPFAGNWRDEAPVAQPKTRGGDEGPTAAPAARKPERAAAAPSAGPSRSTEDAGSWRRGPDASAKDEAPAAAPAAAKPPAKEVKSWRRDDNVDVATALRGGGDKKPATEAPPAATATAPATEAPAKRAPQRVVAPAPKKAEPKQAAAPNRFELRR